MQTIDSSLAMYSLSQAEATLKQANQWFHHLVDESVALNRAVLHFNLMTLEVDDAVALWFPLVQPTTTSGNAVSSPSRRSKTSPRATSRAAATPVSTVSAPAKATAKAPRAPRKTTAAVATASPTVDPTVINDLKLIAGIGPGLEKKLNAAGIQNYAQIAALTPDAIQELERTVVKFSGRITRDDWIAQAKQLLS